ncbi:MAG: ABC transporter permease [Leptonema sp. (in: bacteria)]
MNRLKIYLKMVSLSFQNSITYKIEYFTSLLNALLYIFIFASVWAIVIPENSPIHGISRKTMISYAVLTTLIKSTFSRSQSFFSSKIRTGEIAVELMKPISLPLLYLSDIIGKTLFQIFARGIPLLVFSYFLFQIQLNFNINIFYKFMILYLLSFIIYFFLNFFLSSLAFYFVEVYPFWILYFALITLLSGGIIPIDFFPEYLQSFILFTPFPYLFYFPTMLLLQSELVLPYSTLVLYYCIHIFVLFCVVSIVYWFGLRKLTIAGG